jgi:hypothetical protein
MKMLMLGLDLVSHFYASWRQAGIFLCILHTYIELANTEVLMMD